ncbi:MAG: murein biosynthesis integral membrane protein MurJ [Solirubrobacteraceae bacterium]
MGPSEDSGSRRVSENTAIFAGATAISRVVGLVREILANYLFGTGLGASAFTIASQIPNLMSNLFAQAALSAAFVPVFTDLLARGKKEEAHRLATTLFWIVTLVLGVITLLGIALAGLLLPLLGSSKFDAHAATVMTQVMFPVVLFLGMAGVVTGVLQSYGQFTLAALAPVVWNLVIITLTYVLRHDFGRNDIYAYAVAWTLATVVEFLLITSALRGTEFRIRFYVDWHDPRIREVFILMLPVTIGLGIVNLDALINSTMGTLVSSNGPRAIQDAFLLYMMPQGIFSVAVSTVLFPTLSRQASRRAAKDMRHTVATGMRQINLLLIPSAAGLLALSRPIVRLVFMHGAFKLLSLDLTSQALFWFAFSLPFAGLNLLMTRTFFALQRPWIPTKLAMINMTVDIVLSVGLYKPLGVAGLVIGTAGANIVMAALQMRRLKIGFNGRLELGQTAMITARILVASVLTGVIAHGVWSLVNGVVGVSIPGQIISVGFAIAVAGSFYVWAISHMRVPEWQEIEMMFKRRLGILGA